MTSVVHTQQAGDDRRTLVRLADGRELIYFDDVPGLDRLALDKRDLPPQEPASEIRYDRVLDEWVIIAAHRQGRTHLPATDDCPLCPTAGDRLTEIPAADYHVVTFENRFPSLGATRLEDAGPPDGAGFDDVGGFVRRRPAAGRCEVVCFTSDHGSSFAALPPMRLATVARAWVDRTVELAQLPDVEYVFLFENRGVEIGATLQHPHGQIYAYPFVPPRVRVALESARRWRSAHGGCLFCTVLEAELAAGVRVVAQTPGFVAFVPVAAHWPHEVHIYPRRHVPDLPALDADEQAELMGLYVDVLRRFDALFDLPLPYVAVWHQAPVRSDRELAHLSLQLFSPRRSPGKLKYLAASESGAGAFINDILPEDAAQRLRAAGPG